jgi:branched-chain amino acid transport system ATP-binding protein
MSERPPASAAGPGAQHREGGPVSDGLRVHGLVKRFAGVAALDGIDLHIAPGERVGVIGPNGAGKTTMFNCILGVLRSDGGRVLLDGHDITDEPVHVRARRGIGRTFQRMELFPGTTVREHLLIAERVRRGTGRLWKDLIGRGGPSRDEIARADEVLGLLGLAAEADEPIERMTLGKGRLVEVGRALMTEPALLLLDEPSSGLDRAETDALAQTLHDVQRQKGFSILLVEHDVELVANFTSRAYLLDFGRLILEGPTAAVMASEEMRLAYLGDLEVAP